MRKKKLFWSIFTVALLAVGAIQFVPAPALVVPAELPSATTTDCSTLKASPIFGVPQDVIMRDYLASKHHALEARKSQLLLLRLFKGREAADKLSILMGVEEDWLKAAFEEIDATWGSFENYIHEGLGLTERDVTRLKDTLLSNYRQRGSLALWSN